MYQRGLYWLTEVSASELTLEVLDVSFGLCLDLSPLDSILNVLVLNSDPQFDSATFDGKQGEVLVGRSAYGGGLLEFCHSLQHAANELASR